MKVGIMSDTHDNLPLVDRAITCLNQENPAIVLHAGDYVAPFTVARFEQLQANLIGVYGNNDGDHELLTKRFSEIETAELRGRFAEVILDGVKIALLHGEEHDLLQSLISSGYYDVVAHGHTHEAATYRHGRTVVVNPGEVCGYLSNRSTLALFDTTKRKTDIVQL
jgi:putative phosphoesterase